MSENLIKYVVPALSFTEAWHVNGCWWVVPVGTQIGTYIAD